MQAAYDEILDFLTSGPTLAQIIAFNHSEVTQRRVEVLIAAEEAETLTEDERHELREFLKVSDFIAKLKVRAARRLERSTPPSW